MPPKVAPAASGGCQRAATAGPPGGLDVARRFRETMQCQTHRGNAMAGMWARLRADWNLELRRGAWYRITRLDPLQAVLEVGGRLLEIPSALLQVIERPPRRWTVGPRPRHAGDLPQRCHDPYQRIPRWRVVWRRTRSRDGRVPEPWSASGGHAG